ncbi:MULTISPECIES: ankyrin repeat domain-containing protein [Legionella]|uniref:ankyrin repeat domain-containing protein n=1 Tax=Legionella TaxID=445 RepID=UPI000964B3E1|nr:MULTISPECIES: ankyrin repeat domain-containing protein [Legionella]MBN9226810.1 ankyrin repeat domain-containing protein [Legionella steelei]OJW06640.1 MAG: hypothetical protein BGO44_17770 [Legionella sp. 39-23]
MYERVEREKFFDELLAGLRNSQDKKDWIEAQNLKANELKLLFLKAATKGYLDVVQFLVSLPDLDPAALNNYALQSAVANGHVDVVQFLVSLPGVDPAAGDNHALRWATFNGDLAVVQLLVSLPGVNPAARDNEAIREAAKRDYLDIVLCLATHPAVTVTEDMPEQLQQIIRAVKINQNYFTVFQTPEVLQETKYEILEKGEAELNRKPSNGLYFNQVYSFSKRLGI